MSVDCACELYIKYVSIKLKPQTYRTVKSRLYNHFLVYFKGWNIEDIKPNDYLMWQEFIKSKKYRYRYMQGLHTCNVSFFDYLVTYHNISRNIPKEVGQFNNAGTIQDKKITVWDKKTFHKFIRNVYDPEYKLFFQFLYKTGARLGEARALNWEDVNFRDRTISIDKTISKEFFFGERVVTTPKTKKSIRTIQIDFLLVRALWIHKKYYSKKYGDCNTLFVFGGEKPLAPTTIDKKKNQACKRANIKPIRLHDFRHSHATYLLSHHIPLSVVSERLGHSRKSTTLDIYTHLDPKNEKRVRHALNFL